MTTAIRKALPEDLGTLQRIARETISAKFRAFMPAANVDGFINSGGSDKYVVEHLPLSWVVLVKGEIAGFSVCKDELIDLMMIDHTRHRQGIGTALLHDCEQRLFERYDTIRLDSYETNDQANRFYRKHGFVQTKIVPDTYTPLNKILFEKRRASVDVARLS